MQLKKNVAGQAITFHLITISDGSDTTSGSPSVFVTKDAGTQGAGSGVITHEGNGEWSYLPTQSETDADHVAFTAVLAGSYSHTRSFHPLAEDLATAANLATVDSVVDAVKVVTDQFNFTVAGQVDANALTGGGDDAATIYTYFTTGTNEDAFKADVSALATSASIAALNDLSSADVTAAVPTVGQTADAVWDEALSGHNVAGSTGKAIRQVKEATITVESSVNDLSATTTSFVTDLTETTDDFYNDKVLVFNSGTLSGQARVISDYNGTTKAITLDEAVTSAPSDGDSFIIIATHEHSIDQIQSGLATAAALATVDANVDAVKLKTDLIPADFTNEWNNVYDVQITGITTTVETAAGKHSVAGTVMMSTNAELADGVLTAKKPSDDTTFQTYTVTTSASANNITGVS